MVYKSKIDGGMVVALVVIFLAALVACLYGLSTGHTDLIVIGLLGIILLGGTFFLLLFPIEYRFTEKELVLRFGIMREAISYGEIEKVEPVDKSGQLKTEEIRRFKIFRKDKPTLQVSPVEVEEFLRDLSQRATHLKRRGNQLEIN